MAENNGGPPEMDLNTLLAFALTQQREMQEAMQSQGIPIHYGFDIVTNSLMELMQRPELSENKKFYKSLKKMLKEPLIKQDPTSDCAICLEKLCDKIEIPEDFVPKEELGADVDELRENVAVMPCAHRYHYFCLSVWLEKVATCPTCRHEVKSDEAIEEEEQLKNLEELHASMYS